MSPRSRKTTETDGLNFMFFSLPQEILLQLGTGAVLLTMLGGKVAAQTLQTIGQASEEVFRGDRLPVLKLPVETKSE